MTKLLDLKGIYVHRGSEECLKDIHLSISSGEKVALLGQSGAGKTTLLAIANGTLQPNTGIVKWRGIKLSDLSASQRRKIATLWQDLRLVEELTVAQNINAGALGQHNLFWALGNLLGLIERQACLAYLEATGLEGKFLDVSVQDLSGGQRQRVAIARVLRQHAELLLADEPLSGLDPKLTTEVLQLLLGKKVIHSINIPETCLISLHRPDLLQHFNRVIGLKKGQIVLDCSTNNLAPYEIHALYEER